MPVSPQIQQMAQMLMNPIPQFGQVNPYQMRNAQEQMQGPPPGIINPGRTWGGRDVNNLDPEGVQIDRVYGPWFQQYNL